VTLHIKHAKPILSDINAAIFSYKQYDMKQTHKVPSLCITCLHRSYNTRRCITRTPNYSGEYSPNTSVPWLLAYWLCRWHETYVSELRQLTSQLFITHQVISEWGEPWSWWCRLGKNPDSFIRALCQPYWQRHLGANRRNGRRSEYFAYQHLRYFSGYLTCYKILRHGTSGFT
jgi:hypothetical protein